MLWQDQTHPLQVPVKKLPWEAAVSMPTCQVSVSLDPRRTHTLTGMLASSSANWKAQGTSVTRVVCHTNTADCHEHVYHTLGKPSMTNTQMQCYHRTRQALHFGGSSTAWHGQTDRATRDSEPSYHNISLIRASITKRLPSDRPVIRKHSRSPEIFWTRPRSNEKAKDATSSFKGYWHLYSERNMH
jgi:hypothetical protein